MTPPVPPLVLRSPADLIAVAPFVFGFHPSDSLVVLGTTNGLITFGARHDLPPPPPDELAPLIARQQVQLVTVLGYGPPAAVTSAVLPLVATLSGLGVRINDVLRITDGRWWSYLCSEPLCCPADGTPCKPVANEVAAAAVFQGRVALPNRQALVAQVAPVEGPARAAMTAATARARCRMTDLTARDLARDRSGRLVRRAGRTAVREAERRYRAGRTLTDDEFAWLGTVLIDPLVMDYAVSRSDGLDWRLRLWSETARRVEPVDGAGPACLLGVAAWQAGDGPLARVAIDRALKENPMHRVAVVLDELLCSAVGPREAAQRAWEATGGGRARGTRRRSL